MDRRTFTLLSVAATVAGYFALRSAANKPVAAPYSQQDVKTAIGDFAQLGTAPDPQQRAFNGLPFPLVLVPSSSQITKENLYDGVAANKKFIHDALLIHGAILFRGFPLKDGKDFDKFVHSFTPELKELPYVGGAAPRTSVTGAVFTTNESPPDQLIPFHHEMAQVPKHPHKVYFFCETPPSTGGETPLCLSNEVFKLVDAKYPEFIRELESKGSRYMRIMPKEDDRSSPIGRGWKSTYLTEDKQEAETKLREQGTEFEWLNDEEDCLRTITAVVPAIKEDSRTGKKMWFNSLVAAYVGWTDSRNNGPKAIMFGDKSPMPAAPLEYAAQKMAEIRVMPRWTEGDVMMIDNRTTMHSRAVFTGPRRILASLWVDA
jgi:alpha-ketoglutarate-dependent taurine dioxygenase